MKSLLERLWNTSGASLSKAIDRRIQNARAKPGWQRVKFGPLVNAELFLPRTAAGAWKEMADGTFDHFLYEAVQERLDVKGRIFWDIGAHVGYHSLGFSALGAEVVAFEPNEENAKRLRMHLERNRNLGCRVRHLPLAVADRDGELVFFQSGDVDGGSSGSHLGEALSPYPGSVGFEKTVVPSVRIDTLIEKKGEKPPSVLKIDVEGAESLVLQGGERFFQRNKPILLMEVHNIRAMREVLQLLLKWGYRTKCLDEEHTTFSRCFIVADSDGS